jgi:ankyrin repeat protein
MDFDEEHKSSTVRDPSYLDMGTVRSVTSSQYSHEPQPTTQGGQLNHYNTPQFSALGDSFLDDNDSDKSHQGEEMHGSHHISKRHDTTVLPSSSARVVPPWVDWEVGNASQSMRGPFTCLQGNPIQQNNNLASHQMAGDSMAHRKSTDSGYESKTISIISSGVESPRLSQLPRNLRNSLSQESDRQEWASQNTVLRSISCLENHQGMGFNFHCCGSSCLQDLAIFATNISPDRVYEFLCNYMRFEGVRLSDYAGNTFLHKLAVTGAPWAYFEAAFKARIDPCHLNAYEQTFAHVLNVSKFHDNLIECLSFIRELGIDLGRRDASGRTVLHYLYDQPISPQTAREILNLIETPGRLLCLRDVSGRTPCEIFKHTFQQQASTDPRWSSPEIQLQSIGIFEDIVDDGVLRLGDEGIDWHRVTNNPDELRSKLQSQYKEVIDNATNGIAVEAMDGSNAIHAQASLMAAQNAATDLCDLEKFISVGIDANDYDNRGRTPLEAIITQPRDYENELTKSEKVALLIDKGRASVNSRNRLGHTPLYSAAIRGLDRTVEVLLRRGSHVNIRANNNKSLLDAVQDAWDRALIEYLDSRLDSKYHEAQCSRIEACKVLLERYGAVSNPSPAQSMGYPVSRRPLRQ